MRIGVMLGFGAAAARGPTLTEQVEFAVEAERIGAQICFTSEAYGYDAVSVLAAIGARTSTMGIGAAALQIPARSAAMTAMTATTLDTLTAGRFTLGLGISGPAVSDGWHGVPFGRPLARTRTYVEAVRSALRRAPLIADGPGLRVPATPAEYDPLRLSVRPPRLDLPILLAALGARNLELAGEIADGVLTVWWVPEGSSEPLAHLQTGRDRRTVAAPTATPVAEFDVVALVPTATARPGSAESVADCAERVRPLAALYLGGMGTADVNFYAAQAARLGFAEQAAEVGEHFRAGRLREASAAVPLEFLDATCLLGDPVHVRARVDAVAGAGVTTRAAAPVGGSTRDHLADLATVCQRSA